MFLSLNMSLVGPGEFNVESSSCHSHIQALDFLTTPHMGNIFIYYRGAASPLTGGEN